MVDYFSTICKSSASDCQRSVQIGSLTTYDMIRIAYIDDTSGVFASVEFQK